tara:strand:+ start:562 stop:1149 length:588 start_codon:yes stop_codon:yes gene_type:complete
MAFWSTPLTEGQGDPKRKYRFTVQFDELAFAGSGIIWFAKSVTKPAMTISETEHTFLDKKYYFPGRVEWNTITLTLVDPADPDKSEDAVKQMNSLIEAAGYKIAANPEQLETMSKAKSVSALGAIVINQINDAGKTIESWTLNNAFIKDMKFGDLDYTGDELIELSLELRYDWATCEVFKNDGSSVEKFFTTETK